MRKSKIKEKSKFADYFDASPVGTFILDEGGKLINANEAACKLLGYTKSELIHLPLTRIVSKNHLKYIRTFIHELKTKNKICFEIKLKRKGSKNIHCNLKAAKTTDGKFIVTCSDITKRKKAENKIIKQNKKLLKAKEKSLEKDYQIKKLSIAVEQSGDSIVLTDTKGNIEYVNPRFTETTGYTLEEVLGKNPSIVKSGEVSDEYYQDLWRTITSGDTWKGVFHNKAKNGELFWEEVTISPIKDNKGKIVNFLAIKEDISRIKEIEERYDWENILTNANWGTVIRDADGIMIDSMNTTFAAMHGYTVEELKGKPISLLFPESEHYDLYKVNEVIKREGKYSYESVHIKKDGSKFPVEINASVIKNNKGEVKNFVVTLFDISYKKKLEYKNLETEQSFQYARTIQKALMPSDKLMDEYLPNRFIFYKPKQIIAGDFYWVEKVNRKVFFAAADCTGHGVPGAMVSVVCRNRMHEAIESYGLSKPSDILTKTSELVLESFKESEKQIYDGMDVALCSLDMDTMELEYSGAHNALFYVHEGELNTIKGSRRPVGFYEGDKIFENHNIQLTKGSVIYLFTDGYVDQFGGYTEEERKDSRDKFKIGRLRELLSRIHQKPMDQQKRILKNTIENWQGEEEQIDDICFLGVRV